MPCAWIQDDGRHPDTVLSFYDAVLYKSDVDLFAPGGWLNDHCIVIQCEYLTFVTHAGDDKLLFMHPGTSHFVGFAGAACACLLECQVQTFERTVQPGNCCDCCTHGPMGS